MSDDAGKWIAMGLALGLGIAIIFMLHNISLSIQMQKQPAPQEAETGGVQYLYDDNNRLVSIMPIPVKLKAV